LLNFISKELQISEVRLYKLVCKEHLVGSYRCTQKIQDPELCAQKRYI